MDDRQSSEPGRRTCACSRRRSECVRTPDVVPVWDRTPWLTSDSAGAIDWAICRRVGVPVVPRKLPEAGYRKAIAAARLLFSTDAGATWEPIRAGGRVVVIQGASRSAIGERA